MCKYRRLVYSCAENSGLPSDVRSLLGHFCCIWNKIRSTLTCRHSTVVMIRMAREDQSTNLPEEADGMLANSFPTSKEIDGSWIDLLVSLIRCVR